MSRVILGLILTACAGISVELQHAPPPRQPQATPAEFLIIRDGFKVELLYSVPQQQYGSWVNLCVDPRGRLIVSDQYGLLYRVTPPPLGADRNTAQLKIEPLTAAIGEAQGLCWAFNALYAVVNSNRRASGLYRISSSRNHDSLDRVELLKRIEAIDGHGGGEHGPHAVIPHPDGKRLTVVCGNQCRLVPFQTSRVPLRWGEDHLLPRLPDGRGFMVGVLAPGGCIYHVSPDGRQWELFSTGFRNPYDAAYHKNGDLFTYDADMEWDLNTPWYRPTRICKVASGSDFGWRNGAGKYPPFYPDNLPGVLDIGPGSPTGVCFGYETHFPDKYREAFYVCDWSYGKLYAISLKPAANGCDYECAMEEFVSGTPLPLTDLAANPVDGALYFITGGRKTQSGLYRITAITPVAKNETHETKGPNHIERTQPDYRRLNELEQFHGAVAPKDALPGIIEDCGHSNRYVRYAARIALEHQPLESWKEAVLTNPKPTSNALLALVRSSASCPQHRQANEAPVDRALAARILGLLNHMETKSWPREQQLDHLRVYQVLFNRFGPPTTEDRAATLKKMESLFPTGDRLIDGELAQLLVYLESPAAAERITKALTNAVTQEEQLEYARSLRMLRTGWTPELRKTYFDWLRRAESYKGGMSFGGFLKQIRDDALRNLPPSEQVTFAAMFTAKTGTPANNQRPHVRDYTLQELLPVIDHGLKSGRSFDQGRRMFGIAQCAACHRFDGEGGISGPDLTQAAGRFSASELLESIVDPDKEISDQYAATEFLLHDGRKITGRVINHVGDEMVILPSMLDPSDTLRLNHQLVESMKRSSRSMMPAGTINTLRETEILDLLAYLLSRGNRQHPMFRPEN